MTTKKTPLSFNLFPEEMAGSPPSENKMYSPFSKNGSNTLVRPKLERSPCSEVGEQITPDKSKKKAISLNVPPSVEILQQLYADTLAMLNELRSHVTTAFHRQSDRYGPEVVEYGIWGQNPASSVLSQLWITESMKATGKQTPSNKRKDGISYVPKSMSKDKYMCAGSSTRAENQKKRRTMQNKPSPKTLQLIDVSDDSISAEYY